MRQIQRKVSALAESLFQIQRKVSALAENLFQFQNMVSASAESGVLVAKKVLFRGDSTMDLVAQ